MAAPPLDVSKVGNINGIVGSLSSARFGKSAKGQMSGANSAIFSSRDSTHPVLSAQLVGKARSIFATYCSFCENPAASSPAVASAVRGGGGGGGGGLVSEGSIVMSGPIDLTTASPADQPVGLNAKGVQRFMADIGCIMSENEAKDIIFALSQSGVILHKNAEVERLTVDGAEARSIMMSVRSLNTENSEAAAANSRNLLLTFPLFLELLMSTQSDCSAEDEIRATWNRTRDIGRPLVCSWRK